MDFKFCLLAGGRPGHLLAQIASRTCPKVIISRLIGDDWGARSRSRNAGNSVEPKFEFSNLNYSALLSD